MSDMGIIILFHLCPRCILGHSYIRGHHFVLGYSHFDGFFTLRCGHLIEDFDGSWSW